MKKILEILYWIWSFACILFMMRAASLDEIKFSIHLTEFQIKLGMVSMLIGHLVLFLYLILLPGFIYILFKSYKEEMPTESIKITTLFWVISSVLLLIIIFVWPQLSGEYY